MEKKEQGWIALLAADKRQHLRPEWCWRYRCRFLDIGRVPEGPVRLLRLVWDDESFLLLPVAQRRMILYYFLLKARAHGAFRAGLPLGWRDSLGGRSPLPVPDGRQLALQEVLKEMKETSSLRNHHVAVLGLEQAWQRQMVEMLLNSGARVLLSGRQAQSIAADIYSRQGWAVPVLGMAKAAQEAEIILQFNAYYDLPPHFRKNKKIYYFNEKLVKVEGLWLPEFPWRQGSCPAGLAAALIASSSVQPSAGAQTTNYLTNQA